jgi:hypothetical protein
MKRYMSGKNESSSRKKVILAWLSLGVACSAISSTASLLYWEFTYVQEPNVRIWSPIDDVVGMFVIMPFGWIIALITPAGWLSIIGLGLSLYKKSFKPLVLSAVGSLLFGVFWPKYFVGIMGI